MAEMEWRPIETAPKDEAILVGFSDLEPWPEFENSPIDYEATFRKTRSGRMIAYFDEYYTVGGGGYRGLSGWVDATSGEACEDHYGAPTHWMPLPKHPPA